MYIQYRKIKNKYEVILANNRPDEDNKAILNGDYLDKTPTYDEEGHEIPFEMPSIEELLKQCIFPDWQEGDVLVVAQEPLKHPKWSDELQSLVEMTREEICESGDLSILCDGEKFQDGHIVQVPNPSTKYLRYSWDKETFTWKLIATKEELQQARKNLILDYSKKKEEIAILESVKEFNTVDDVKTSKEELAKKKEEIDELTTIIEEMNKKQ